MISHVIPAVWNQERVWILPSHPIPVDSALYMNLNKAKIQSSLFWWPQFSVSFPRGLIPKVQYLFGGKAGHLCARRNKVAHLRKPYKGHKQSPLENLTRHMTKSSSLTRSWGLWFRNPEPGVNCGQSPATERHWLEIFLCQLAAHIWDRIDWVAQSRKRTERKERHQFDGCTDPIVCTTTQRTQQCGVPRDTKEPLVTWHQSTTV